MTLRLAAALCATALSGAGSSTARAENGIASVYAYSGGRTASGERANPTGMTAAHRTLPFGTQVRVTNRRNGQSVVVRINDRGPFARGRVIDVTPAAARVLGFSGLAPVSLDRASGFASWGFGGSSLASAPTRDMRQADASIVNGKD